MFVKYLLDNNYANKIYMLGFCAAVISYSFWKQTEEMLQFSKENEGSIFYIGIAFSFCCYTSAYLINKWNKWRWIPLIAFLVCVSRFTREVYLLYYPEETSEYNMLDYLNFLLTVYMVFNYYMHHRRKQFKKD